MPVTRYMPVYQDKMLITNTGKYILIWLSTIPDGKNILYSYVQVQKQKTSQKLLN